MIRKRLQSKVIERSQFAYRRKWGIDEHENINPFMVARKVNSSTSLYFFKYRVLHGDIYSKVRMLKFKMTNNSECDYCNTREDEKHLMWECGRASNIWGRIQTIVSLKNRELIINFSTLLIGFSPTMPVEESIITRVLRSIISRERSEMIAVERLKCEMLEHCRLNIEAEGKKGETKMVETWKEYKDLFRDNL